MSAATSDNTDTLEDTGTSERAENINMDLSAPVIIETEGMEWVSSPRPGVERRRLEREYAESGRATSIVRYLPGTSFPRHVHGGGEEYFVLQGTFSDGDGDFNEGFYVRNPPGSSHQPFSKHGCTIFVKLGQMLALGEPHVVVDSQLAPVSGGLVDGHAVGLLFQGPGETVTLERLSPNVSLGDREAGGGEEFLILEGSLQINGKTYGSRTWCRTPAGAPPVLSSQGGCALWVKRLSR